MLVGFIVQVDALLSQSQAKHGVIEEKIRMINVPVRLESQPFLKYVRFALAFVLTCSLLIRTLLDNQFHFTPDALMLDERPLFAADIDMASRKKQKTEDGKRKIDREGGP